MTQRLRPALQVVLEDLLADVTPADLTIGELLVLIENIGRDADILRPRLGALLHDLVDQISRDELDDCQLLLVVEALTTARKRVSGTPGPPSVANGLRVIGQRT